MADVVYNSFKEKVMKGQIDLVDDTIRVALVDSSYTPDKDAHEDYADLSGEVSGTGYSAGGKSLANKTVTKDVTDNEGVFDADDITWSSSTITARGAVVYKDSGTDTSSWLIAYFDFGSSKSSSSGDFTVQWGSEGIVNIS
jgi:hypothetical protein